MKKIRRVVLIHPNQKWLKTDMTTTWNLTPYSLCLLATMMKDMVKVKIIDAQFYNMSKKQFRKEVEAFDPDLAGISLISTEYAPLIDTTADILRQLKSDLVIVAGGVHVTIKYKEVMKNNKIDYAIRGEGEYVFPQLIKYLNSEGEFPKEGVVFRKNTGELVALQRTLVKGLDALPFPDYDIIDFKAYSMVAPRYGLDSPTVFPHVRFPTTRGCPIGCSFCQVGTISGNKLRLRSAKNIIEELKILKKKHGIKSFNFEDDNAFFHKGRAKELLGMMIKEKLNLKWKATGVFLPTADEELFELMAKSGCEMINVAIESGSERVLKEIIGKPIDLKTAPEKIALAKKYALYMAANFIIGVPGETWNEIRQTLKYAETCGADYVKIFLAIPLEGTKMYDLAKKFGCIIGDESKVDQRYSVMKGPDYDPKDLSILRVYEWDRINFTDPEKRKKTAKMMNISLEELDKLRLETRKALTFEEPNNNIVGDKNERI